MKLEEYLDEKYVDEIKKILDDKYLVHLTTCCEKLIHVDEVEFIHDFDFWLTTAFFVPLPNDEENIKLERLFYIYLGYKILKGITIIDNYFEHCDNVGKTVSEKLNDLYDIYHFKLNYLRLRMRSSHNAQEIEELKKIESYSPRRKSRKILVNSKILNISDRYHIACQIFNIDRTLYELNISGTEKHQLLAHILGCNQQTARELFNGTHQKRTPIQEDVLMPYLKSINKQ